MVVGVTKPSWSSWDQCDSLKETFFLTHLNIFTQGPVIYPQKCPDTSMQAEVVLGLTLTFSLEGFS